jgi:hypothetical protein
MDKKLNLKIINKKYKSSSARKGLSILKRLIKEKDNFSLSELLRDHRQKPVRYFFEVEYRQQIDDLLDYYSLLEIGIIAGYFPRNLNKSITKEIREILYNENLIFYYKEYYPLYLPQVLLKNIDSHVISEDGVQTKNQFYFETFLIINDSIKFDVDIDKFLWFLDGGKIGDYSIIDFWAVLEDVNLISYKFQTQASHPLNHVFWGFIKYLQFLHEYTELLRKVEKEKILQSSFWHYQSYWFNNENKLQDIVERGLGNIKKAIDFNPIYRLIENSNSYITNAREYEDWRNNLESLNSIEEDIRYLYNPLIKLPIIEKLENN